MTETFEAVSQNNLSPLKLACLVCCHSNRKLANVARDEYKNSITEVEEQILGIAFGVFRRSLESP